MKFKLHFFCILCFTYSTIAYCQNLVPNYSFENTTSCVNNISQIDSAPFWSIPPTRPVSSELFHRCSNNTNVSVPGNTRGLQEPATGDAYAGIIVYSKATNTSEYLQSALTNTLTAGECYNVSFKVVLSKSSPIATDRIGAYFSNTNTICACGGSGFVITTVAPQVISPSGNFLTDKENWIKIQGTFIASGGENYMTIGRFWDKANTDTISTPLNLADIASFPSFTQDQLYMHVDDVSVLQGIAISEDQTICSGQSAQLNYWGMDTAVWTVLSGESIAIGNNFSCNSCNAPIASPSVTTSYLVTNSQGCSDTVVINVVNDFTYTLQQSRDSACLLSEVMYTIQTQPTGNYNYLWTPSENLNINNIANPIGIYTNGGMYRHYIDIISPNGCIKKDSVEVYIANTVIPEIEIYPLDTTICPEESVLLQTQFKTAIFYSCNIGDTLICSNISQEVIVGNVTDTSFSFPNPVNFPDEISVRQQLLFLASELNAMGMMQGLISEISWEIIDRNNVDNLDNFRIDIGCTNVTNLTNWQPNLINVFTPKNINPDSGYITFTFDKPFFWDGTSNLVINTCYHVGTFDVLFGFNSQHRITKTTTPFQSAIWAIGSEPVCFSTNISGQAFERPVTTFKFCSAEPNLTPYLYTWTSDTYLDDATLPNPTSTPTTDITYTFEWKDSLGICGNKAQLSIYIDTTCEELLLPFGLFIPNAFSPNGDGFNDFFQVRGDGIDNIVLKIYDRWGNRVFETTDINIGWDGFVHHSLGIGGKGKRASKGVYVYHITGNLNNKQKIEYKGNLSLVR